MTARETWRLYSQGLRTAARNNVTAYGYSVLITASLAVMSRPLGTPDVRDCFVFLGGAVAAFALVEAVASRGFRVRLREEPSEVIALAGAMSILSAGAGLGVVALLGEVVGGRMGWFVGPFAGTLVYLLSVGAEVGLARLIEDRIQDSGGGRHSSDAGGDESDAEIEERPPEGPD